MGPQFGIPGYRTHIETLQKVQNVALRRILGVIKTTPIQAAGVMTIPAILNYTTKMIANTLQIGSEQSH
jgi:hypothetical protein